MNRILNRKRAIAGLIATLHVATSTVGYASQTDLSNAPLANVEGTAAVKPNIMFVLDDSGSMAWDFTPDWVYTDQRSGQPDPMNCFDSKDDDNVITVTPANSSVPNSRLDRCERGDPPYMSSDFNKQYYNPAIYYRPPIKHDGTIIDTTELPSQNAANTSNWQQVLKDGFGVQETGTIDLVTGYPDRVWCTSKADDASSSNCRRNSAYTYPDNTYGYGLTSTGSVKYVYGSPYYYTIGVTEYCTTPELTACNVQAAPDATYPYAGLLRWCKNSSFSDCRSARAGVYSDANSYLYPKLLGTVVNSTTPARQASGVITIGNSGSDASVNISSITINGVNIIAGAGPIVAAGGTNTSSERNAVAAAVAAAINAAVSAPDYTATVTGATVTVTAATTGPADNGRTITVNSNLTLATPVTATLTVSSSSSTGAGSTIDNLTVNGVRIISTGTKYCDTTNTSTCAGLIRDWINAYTATSGFTASRTGSSVIITAPAASGTTLHGASVVESGTVGTDSPRTMSAVTQGLMPVTTSPMAGGSDADALLKPNRTGVAPFGRVDIVPGNTYPKYPARIDCAGASCTYEEEMTNFANWYAYYRTRMQMMKSSVGHAFLSLNENYRLGFDTINHSNGFTNSTLASLTEWLPLSELTDEHKKLWYQTLYKVNPTSGTPLRTALDRIGKYYQGTLSGPADPVEHSCQQNFTILTTDGYWNDSFSGIGNQDATATTYCTRENGCLHPGSASNTLADVALYYYKTDLRPGTCDKCTDNVPTTAKDPNPAQHMTTFTLGLGVDGTLLFNKNYETLTSGDFYKIRTGVMNWPNPVANTESAVDDLWHAAVNGHGAYFSAKDPQSLADGLADALSNLRVRNAAASASATSTPNVTQEDNDIFSATFRTVKWDGELVAQKVDTATGNLLPTVTWEAKALLDAKATETTDSRVIYTLDASTSIPGRKSFTWGSLTTAEQDDFFKNKCVGASTLSQCSLLTPAQQSQANSGENMVRYLRGQSSMETAGIYRDREHLLGDIASAKPAYVRNPRRNYGDIGYGAYKAAQASRQAMVYVAANDGMLHALNATTGQETWAYVPRIVMPNLWRLASENYSNNHRYYVDGSPESGDVYFSSDSAWHTILVGGLNKGGRGYYALDITDPANPRVLWEICADSSLCAISDSDIGYSYGNPIITKRPSDGKWVVVFASGYNNVSPGSGRGFLYVLDAESGAILEKIDTGVGDTTTPSGLAKITGRAENAQTDNTASTIYGGDLLGNLWRFDMATSAVVKLAVLTTPDTGNAVQPITSRPDVGLCENHQMVYVGTGKYLGISDLTDIQTQSMYGIKDDGTALGTFRAGSGTSVVQQTFLPIPGGYTISNNPVTLASQNGWYVDFDQNEGERVNLDPALVLGTLVVVTNQPENVSACSIGGNSYKYEFNYCTGSYLLAAPNQLVGKKIGSSIAVGFIVIRLPSGALKVITTFAGSEKTTEGVTGSGTGKVRRVSWRELTQ